MIISTVVPMKSGISVSQIQMLEYLKASMVGKPTKQDEMSMRAGVKLVNLNCEFEQMFLSVTE